MKYNKLDLHQPNNKYPFYRQPTKFEKKIQQHSDIAPEKYKLRRNNAFFISYL